MFIWVNMNVKYWWIWQHKLLGPTKMSNKKALSEVKLNIKWLSSRKKSLLWWICILTLGVFHCVDISEVPAPNHNMIFWSRKVVYLEAYWRKMTVSWWRHQMETFSPLLAFVRGIGGFPSQRPVTWSFDDFFDLRLTNRLSKQSRRWWFETPSCTVWRHCNRQLQVHGPTTAREIWMLM